MNLLYIIFMITAFYLACGFIFAIAFIIKGVSAIDQSANGAGIGFRIIIIPGVIFFWPFLLKKWIRLKKRARVE